MRVVFLGWLLALLANSVYLPVVMGPSGPGGQTIPTATSTPIPPTPVPTATLAPTPTATVPAAVCGCVTDEYNCSDFDTQAEAQACYDYCLAETGKDIHNLDSGGVPGVACESLPLSWKIID